MSKQHKKKGLVFHIANFFAQNVHPSFHKYKPTYTHINTGLFLKLEGIHMRLSLVKLLSSKTIFRKIYYAEKISIIL